MYGLNGYDANGCDVNDCGANGCDEYGCDVSCCDDLSYCDACRYGEAKRRAWFSVACRHHDASGWYCLTLNILNDSLLIDHLPPG